MAYQGGGFGPPAGPPGPEPAVTDVDYDPELAAAIENSYKTRAGAAAPTPPPSGVINLEDSDRDLNAAILQSLQRPDVVNVEDDELQRVLELSRREEEQRRHMDDDDVVFQGSSSSAAASSAKPMPPPSASFLRPFPRGDEVASNAAVDGSSRGSSRERVEPEMDPQLAAAIEASYAAQTETARADEEANMLRQAMEISRQEEERRQNQALRAEQEAELQESILRDQMREQEEKRRRVEEEEQRKQAEAKQREEERDRHEAAAQRQQNVPAEPPTDAPDRVDLQIRVPDGRRVRRRFLSSHNVGQVYDYLFVEGFLGDEAFQLVSTMPRKEYKDRDQSLADAGLQGQCALLLERTQSEA